MWKCLPTIHSNTQLTKKHKKKQKKQDKFIVKELQNMEDNRLKYIYFECFGKKEKNKQIILENINLSITTNSKKPIFKYSVE